MRESGRGICRDRVVCMCPFVYKKSSQRTPGQVLLDLTLLKEGGEFWFSIFRNMRACACADIYCVMISKTPPPPPSFYPLAHPFVAFVNEENVATVVYLQNSIFFYTKILEKKFPFQHLTYAACRSYKTFDVSCARALLFFFNVYTCVWLRYFVCFVLFFFFFVVSRTILNL